MRTAFSNKLVQLAKLDPNVILLTGDHGYNLFDDFRKQCPAQYINAGIAEQNMVGVSAGLARSGYWPIVYGLSAFIPVRVLEQIKIDIAHDNLPVLFVGDGAGFVYSHLGSSHQSTEDIACARSIPGLSVYSPADRFEVDACIQWAYKLKKPTYLRLGKADRGDIHNAGDIISQEKLQMIKVNKLNSIAIIATGSMVSIAKKIASESFPNASVWSVPSIKPVDKDKVISLSRESEAIIVLEEHSIFGGLGSIITEICSEYSPLRILRIGVLDKFSHLCGDYEYLLEEHNLDPKSITDQIMKFISLNS